MIQNAAKPADRTPGIVYHRKKGSYGRAIEIMNTDNEMIGSLWIGKDRQCPHRELVSIYFHAGMEPIEVNRLADELKAIAKRCRDDRP